MKTIINRTYLSTVRLALCAGVVVLAACTKEEAAPTYTDAQITPQAQLPTLGVEQEPNFKSRAAADPTQAMTLWFARADETGNNTNSYGAYGATAISATRSAGAGVAALSFATPQYYISNNARSRFTGWWPVPTSFTGGVVSWTMDGSQDILTAPVQEGNIATPLPTFAFEHRLSRLNFEVVANSAASIALWGTISAVNILAQPTTCTYTPATDAATGSVAVSGSTTYAAKNFASGELTTTAVARGDAMFIASSTTDVALSLSVVSSTRGTVPVTVAARRYEAGKAYKLTLSFVGTTLTATVVPWNDVTTDDKLGVLRIGDLKDGGLVFWIDPTDSKKYKVMSLEESATKLKWSAADSYVVSGAQSNDDGKANSAAIKAAFDAKVAGVAIAETTFDAAFPAAAYCYNYQGLAGTDAPGTWYVPAKSELQYLWCAYNGKAPIIWGSGTSAAAPADAAKKTEWNARITAGGGAKGITSSLFWSSTERSSDTDKAWYVIFSSGNTDAFAKINSFSVRCVKSIAPPPPPAVGDYYYADGSFATALIAGKTATGMVYYVDPADPKKRKVMSLEEAPTTLAWAKVNTYVVSGAQSDADGKANSAAVRAYFEANAGTVGADYAVAFPAFNYCYNYKGKSGSDAVGTWYVPAKSELQYLWCAYNGKAPTTWAGPGTSAAAPADAAKQTEWNARITAAGIAAGITSSTFWSSTEYSNFTGNAWYVLFSSGFMNYFDKSGSNYVRCVSEL